MTTVHNISASATQTSALSLTSCKPFAVKRNTVRRGSMVINVIDTKMTNKMYWNTCRASIWPG